MNAQTIPIMLRALAMPRLVQCLGEGERRVRVSHMLFMCFCSHAVTVQVHRVARATSGRQPPPLIMLRWVARTFLVPRSYRGTLAGIVVIAVLR